MSESQPEKPSNKPDRWKSIASLLGVAVPEAPSAEPEAGEPPAPVAESPAEVDAEVEVVVEPVISLAPPTATRKSEPKPKSEKVPRKASWAALCGELGIEVPPEPVTEEQAPAAIVPANLAEEAELSTFDESIADESTDDESTDDESTDDESTDDESTVDESTVDEVNELRSAFLDVERSEYGSSNDEADLCAAAEDVEVSEDLDESGREEAVSDEDEASDEAGETAALRRRRRRRRRRTGSTARDESIRDESGEQDEPAEVADLEPTGPSDNEVLDVELVEDAVESLGSDENEGEDEEAERGSERRRRPRRRRRRGRRDATAADTESVKVPSSPGDLDDDEHVVDDIEDDDDDDDDEVNLDLDDDDEDDDLPAHHVRDGSRVSGEEGRRGGEASSRSKHKKIPTWEEAISVIVSANMETRRRDGNAGRSRPRGGGGARRRGRGSSDRRG